MADTIDLDSSPTGYGSHMPALRALARFTDIRKVVEFGGGPYSTGLFLSRKHFPLLESLVTFEHADGWAKNIRTDDPRHRIVVVSPDQFIYGSSCLLADFVFVDSTEDEKRPLLLRHGLTIAPIAAIHDRVIASMPSSGFKYVRAFNSIIQTVFVSNTVDLDGLHL